MSQEYELSPSEEEYLEAIYTKQEGRARVATTHDLAECLGVQDASVTEMLKKLSEKGLVHYTPYHGATLTEAGREIATKVKRKHRLLERFLVDICGDRHTRVTQTGVRNRACHLRQGDRHALRTVRATPRRVPAGVPYPRGEYQEDEKGREFAKLSDVGKGDVYDTVFNLSRTGDDQSVVFTRPHPRAYGESAAKDLEGPDYHRDEGYANRSWQGCRRVTSRRRGRERESIKRKRKEDEKERKGAPTHATAG